MSESESAEKSPRGAIIGIAIAIVVFVGIALAINAANSSNEDDYRIQDRVDRCQSSWGDNPSRYKQCLDDL